MQNVLVLIFLSLFGLSTLLTYLGVRRRWTRVLIITLLSILADTLTIAWASITRGTMLVQAFLIGLALALMFTGMTVSIGMFYRTNPPGQLPNPPRKPAIRPVSSLSSHAASSSSQPPQPPQPPPSSPQSPPSR